MYFDPIYWLFLLPGVLLGIYAQIKLSGTYKKYARLGTQSGLTGAQAAREVLDRAGLTSIPIREVPGHLTDHYDPLKRTLCLSSDIYQGRSIASIGVAAHEAGHALQHKAAYAPLKLRMFLVPATQFAGQAYIPIFLLGLFVPPLFPKLILAVVAIFAIITVFQLVTLPVEFDASRRAKEQLARMGLIDSAEGVGVAKVLNAAALTYVAAMVTSILQLLYWVMVARNSNR